MEELALRKAVARGDSQWEAAVLASAHRLRRAVKYIEGEPSGEWIQLHGMFHHALVSGCGSPRLIGLHSHLYQQSQRYRLLSVSIESDRPIDDEHQALVDAALDRDADLLVRLTRAHLQGTTRYLIQAARAREVAAAG